MASLGWQRWFLAVVLPGAMLWGCSGDSPTSDFRVLTWNAAHCERHTADMDEEIAAYVALQAREHFANVILLQEITHRATDTLEPAVEFATASQWQCAWRPAWRDGIATCVQGTLSDVSEGDFRPCFVGQTDDGEPFNGVPNRTPDYGTCLPEGEDTCGSGRDGFGWLKVRYRDRMLTNVHVQQGGLDDGGLPRQPPAQIGALHQDIAGSGIVAGDFNWETPEDCDTLDPAYTCSDWFATNDASANPVFTTRTTLKNIDHIATVEQTPGTPFFKVLGFGQAAQTCQPGSDAQACVDPDRPCSNHCMVFASFDLPVVDPRPEPLP